MEVEKVKEEVAIQTSRLTEAYNNIKSLENSISQAEMTVASLTEQSNSAQVEITNLENELKKQKDETETQASKLADTGKTIKSLEDALVKAENDFSALQGEKRTADQEISTLNSKLNACMEELAGSSGSLASRSIELIGHLNNLQMLAKDQSLLSTMKQCFDRNLELLKDMDLTIKNTTEHFLDKDLELLRFSDDIDNTVNIEMENDEANAINADDVSSCFRRVAEGFQLRNTILADRFEDATGDLQFEVKNDLIELSSVPGLEKLNHGLHPETGEFVRDNMAQQDFGSNRYAQTTKKLLTATRKVQKAEEPLLSASQLRTLLHKLSGIEIPLVESEDLEPQSSVDVKKLFSVIDSFIDLQDQINLLSYEKEELHSTLSRRIFEIEHLRRNWSTC
ncbi:hypothetical protein CRYUN_Cryun04dG0153900 [Craigia yunnanensis]